MAPWQAGMLVLARGTIAPYSQALRSAREQDAQHRAAGHQPPAASAVCRNCAGRWARGPEGPAVTEKAVRLAFIAAHVAPTAASGEAIPLGPPGPWRALRDWLRPGADSQADNGSRACPPFGWPGAWT
ncbi:hypothetical protein NHF46_08550 [Arthrobacter alpinus]|nr:hypothetical protein [Arthrobacter alpinus]